MNRSVGIETTTAELPVTRLPGALPTPGHFRENCIDRSRRSPHHRRGDATTWRHAPGAGGLLPWKASDGDGVLSLHLAARTSQVHPADR